MEKQFKASLFDELDSLYPDTRVEDGVNYYTLATANESYGGVHILLTGLKIGSFITLETVNPNNVYSIGQFGGYKFFEMLSVPVEANSGAETRTEWTMGDVNTNVIRRAPFMIYDVLKPCPNVLKVTSEVMALAFRFKVKTEHNTNQKWELIINHENQTQRLTVVNEAFKVTVPKVDKDDHQYVNWFGSQKIAEAHNTEFLSDEWYKMFEKYLRLAVYGRQNLAVINHDMVFDFDGVNVPTLDTKKMDRIIKLFDDVGIYWIEGPHLAGRLNGAWEATTSQTICTEKPIPGEGEKDLEQLASQLYDYIKANNLQDRWVQSVMDEPTDWLADSFNLVIATVKKAMPGIKIIDATIARETIEDSMDIWCPTIDKYERYKSFFDDQVENKGKELFVYTCLNPAGNYCNRFLDNERLRPVYIGWAPMLYPNITGFLHWGGMYLADVDPYRFSHDMANITDYETGKGGDLPPGDSAITYPGYKEVYSTTRLEAHRIGFEDLHLLTKLKEKSPEKCAELVAKVFKGYADFEKDIKVYRATRRELLKALS